MKITKIEVQKKNKSRVNLYLDGEFNCGLSLETIIKNGIKEGREITDEQLEFLKIEGEKEVALSKAIKYISKFQKTETELKTYLKKKEFCDDIIEYVLDKLKIYGFVDDKIFAQNYIKAKTINQGKRKLAYNLRKKGLKDDLIDSVLDNFCQDENQIEKVATKYLQNKPRDIKTKQRAYRYLASRGYESSNIISCLNNFFDEQN